MASPPHNQTAGLPEPLGVSSNFTDPYTFAPSLRTADTAIVVLTTLTLVVRMYTRFLIAKTHGWEDYTMFVAWIGFLVYSTLDYPITKYGGGSHQWDVPASQISTFLWWNYIRASVYAPLIIMTKLSLSIQFLHIFVLGRDARFWCVQAFIWVNAAYFTACFFLTVFMCSPVQRAWESSLEGSCLNESQYGIATAVFNSVGDVLMLIFPVVCIWELRISVGKKVGISAVFFLGTIGLAASIMRIVYTSIYNNDMDLTYTLPQICACAAGEIAAGILVGNFIYFPRFFRSFGAGVDKFFSTYRSGAASASREASSRSWPALKSFNAGHHVELGDQNHTSQIYKDQTYTDQEYKSILPFAEPTRQNSNRKRSGGSLDETPNAGLYTSVSGRGDNTQMGRLRAIEEGDEGHAILRTVEVDQRSWYME